ncbi:MAG: DUF3526 domain-containing protein [Bacteroidota bacterium]
MKNFLHILSFEWKNLWRNHTLKVLLLVFLGAGIYGIYFGKFEIEKQEARMETVQQYERQQFDSLMTWVHLDTTIEANKNKFEQAVSPTGVGWNKHFTYYFTHDTPVLAGLCLGQRDLYPVYYGVNVTDLARQVNVGELANPMKLLSGNFDLSYVFVFLLPLLLISFFYNLYAGEKEGGTLSLLQSQAISLNFILISKGLLRLILVGGVATLLLVLGFLLQGISLWGQMNLFLSWLLVIFGYTLVWTLMMAGMVALKRGSSLTAMLGLGLWLLFTLITPAIITLFVNANEPIPNRAKLVHSIRSLNGQIWDSPKSFVLDQFYGANPQFDSGDTTNFDKWYYASFTILDKEIDALKSELDLQVDRRNTLLKNWEWLAPAALVHEKLARLSDTDRQSHMGFVRDLYLYHQKLKDVYYARIFAGDQFSLEDLEELEKNL